MLTRSVTPRESERIPAGLHGQQDDPFTLAEIAAQHERAQREVGFWREAVGRNPNSLASRQRLAAAVERAHSVEALWRDAVSLEAFRASRGGLRCGPASVA